MRPLGPRPRMFAAASAARFAMRHRMPTIASVDKTGYYKLSSSEGRITKTFKM